jgi:hypothetical protein
MYKFVLVGSEWQNANVFGMVWFGLLNNVLSSATI